MAEYKGTYNTLLVGKTPSDGKLGFRVQHPGGYSYHSAQLSGVELRDLRDQINEHIGDTLVTKSSLPVGTIVVGEGLTEAQKRRLPDTATLREAAQAIGRNVTGFRWEDTAEGYAFWLAIHSRLDDLHRATEADKKRQKKAAKRTDVGSFSVITDADNVLLTRTRPELVNGPIGPSEARDLAAALLKHADAAENK